MVIRVWYNRRMAVKNIFLIIIIIIAAAAPYINSMHNPFIWDEEEIIVKNPVIKDWSYLPHVFKTNIFGTAITPSGYYRPMYTLSFMADYNIWGLNTFGYHLFNILFHVLNAILLYLLLMKLGLDRKIACFSSVLFAVYPINCEAVTLIAARVELIAGFLLLSCMICFINGVKGRGLNFLLSIIFFALAMLTKESVMVFPFILLAYTLIFVEKKPGSKAILPLMVLILMAAFYGIARFLLLGHSPVTTLSLINSASFIEKVFTLPGILFTYVSLILFPVRLISEYDFVLRSFWDPRVWLAAFLLIAMFSAAYLRLKPKKYPLFFISWFLISLAPYFNIIIPLHATLMEHWAYFSTMGFAALSGIAVFNMAESASSRWLKGLLILMAASLIGFYIAKITERNMEWSDPFRLYQADVKKEPNSFLLHCNLGVEYFRRGMTEEAEKEFLECNNVSPGGKYDTACNNLGVIYARKGRTEEAIALYKESIDINNYPLAYENLGGLYNAMGKHRDAVLILEKGAELYPLNINILYQLGIAYYMNKEFGPAKQMFLRVEGIQKNYSDTAKFLNLLNNLTLQTLSQV
ncbi:MAG: tetratricopeptide repeat protein [Candidatus Omnitrophota bacterium]|nr:tetratricopeptide repeat protein [Candidatus Omnitrophota bacterium]